MNVLACADRELWKKLTSKTSVSADVHLLCLNAMCDNDVSCAKDCLEHVTQDIRLEDISTWKQCTYSSTCAEIHGYHLREQCADNCLESHKIELRKKAEMQRRHEEERRKKEAEALQAASGSQKINLSNVLLIGLVAMMCKVNEL